MKYLRIISLLFLTVACVGCEALRGTTISHPVYGSIKYPADGKRVLK